MRCAPGHYWTLSNLYGAIDLMDPVTLAATLDSLAPTTITSETRSLQDRQSQVMLNNVADRLSMLGTGPTGVISMNGSTELVGALSTGTVVAVAELQRPRAGANAR